MVNMKIKNHRLYTANDKPVRFVPTVNKGGIIQPRYLIMHYTAGPNAENSINWFTNPLSSASAHLVIARNGEITQLVPFNQKAWHAGISEWNNLKGLNNHSIGIEMDNAGKLVRFSQDHYLAWFGDRYDAEEVVEATHKNETDPAGWHIFTREQLNAAVEVAALLMRHYKLEEVLGHDDISPYRKVDPGPAFPMASFRSKVVGRAEDEVPTYLTTTNLNIRSGPGVSYEKLDFAPLKTGTKVEILNYFEDWRYVEVMEFLPTHDSPRGWVNGKYLRKMTH